MVVAIRVDLAQESDSDCPNVRTELSGIRKRRHLVFPEGTNFAITISLVKAFMTHAPSGWNVVLEIDVLFPMPDANFTNASYRRKLHHRQKRQFWEKLQTAIDFHNLNGQACILRSICEAKTHLAPPGKSLVHDLLRVIFTVMPKGLSSAYAVALQPELQRWFSAEPR
ncbi:hypothetical protein MSG28_001509 [Choristoneura fumiferana]|uniref:Uncharacterized protein n=1 Tax=Choristoneura fumiferana TaxID=7141 RepID=A0ACC0KV78_CHOFU|nr:hypothetical protein MSG28_001509 [Choristoneura fumiferana]